LGLLYWVMRAWQAAADERAEWLGAFCTLCMCSIDLFDDVQDEDLAGKPHQCVGPAFAVNDALALMFLALEALRRALELENDVERRMAYLAAFNRVAILGVRSQHRDLLGPQGATTTSEVVERDAGKTGVVTLFLECGALLAGCTRDVIGRYRAVGGRVASLAQIVDDLRDIFAKPISPDLASRKLTYPIAWLFERGPEQARAKYCALLPRLPESLPEICDVLYDAGVVEACAERIEELRQGIHSELRDTGNHHGAHHVLCRIANDLAGAVYEPSLGDDEGLPATCGDFRGALDSAAERFAERMRLWNAPESPVLVPWHHPHFFAQSQYQLIRYPDVDDLPEEVLAFHASLLGTGDLEVAKRTLIDHAEFFLAHELFHDWRASAERVTEDHWHEEYVCDRLAYGYLVHHDSELAARLIETSKQIVHHNHALFGFEPRQILKSAAEPGLARQCELDAATTATWHAELLVQLAAVPVNLNGDMLTYLDATPQSTRSDVSALRAQASKNAAKRLTSSGF
jgi:geranylgeranyl pyrophosphate synthase